VRTLICDRDASEQIRKGRRQTPRLLVLAELLGPWRQVGPQHLPGVDLLELARSEEVRQPVVQMQPGCIFAAKGFRNDAGHQRGTASGKRCEQKGLGFMV